MNLIKKDQTLTHLTRSRSNLKKRVRLLEVLRRAETGPMIDEKDFEAKLVASTAEDLIEKY